MESDELDELEFKLSELELKLDELELDKLDELQES